MSEPIGRMCQTDRHRVCGGHNCHCPCHPGTPQERAASADKAVADWLTEICEVAESSGRHDGHTLSQVGPCVYCSCGYRYQGRLPYRRESGATP